MKNRFGKILGPVLIAALLVSPMLGAVRVSADTLSWSAETIPPSATVLEDVYVPPDGTTVYLLSNDGAVTSLWRYYDCLCNVPPVFRARLRRLLLHSGLP